jgi:hypothetical protein
MKELFISMKRAKIFLLKVKSCKALLRMLRVCISSYLKSVLRYKLLIFDTHHPIICPWAKVFWIRGYFSKPITWVEQYFDFVHDMSVVIVRGGGGLEPLVAIYWTSLVFHNMFQLISQII